MDEPITIRDERPLRVLVEAPAPWNWAVKEAKSLPGVEVTYCPGPATHTDLPCPVTAGQGCWRAEDADVIIAGLGVNYAEGRRIVRGLREQHPDTPVVVLAWRTDVLRDDGLLDGCETVVFPWTTHKVREAVERALGVVFEPV